MMLRIGAKLKSAWQLLRYGPTRLQELQQAQASLEAQLGRMRSELLDKADAAVVEVALATLRAEMRREGGWLRDRMLAQESRHGAAAVAGAADPAPASAATQAFYLALERHFRGTREELQQRLQTYRSWIESLPAGPVADLGCGRGEWVELLKAWGREAVGVDLNPLFVQHVRELGLRAEAADVLQWLRQQPDGSWSAITSFHLVEHLPFSVLLEAVEQARRVLVPGGRLILETPNPENLGVATQSFWLDPTHQRPLPPPLLEFIAVHAGLVVEATLRLSPPAPQPIADPTLRELLMQGRDYAVIARKPDEEGR